jgi:hypothetical protein
MKVLISDATRRRCIDDIAEAIADGLQAAGHHVGSVCL